MAANASPTERDLRRRRCRKPAGAPRRAPASARRRARRRAPHAAAAPPAHRLFWWSAKDGAATPNAYAALEDALAGLSAAPPSRWAAQVAVHHGASASGAAGAVDAGAPVAAARESRAGDLHLVSLPGDVTRVQLVARAEGRALELEAGGRALLEAFGLSRRRAALQLEGARFTPAGGGAAALARATAWPSNDLRGLAVELEAAGGAAGAAALYALVAFLREAAAAAAPGAALVEVAADAARFGLDAPGGGEAAARLAAAVRLAELQALAAG